MHIDNYTFGSMTVDGKVYHQDLIVFPDHIQSDWIREAGHSLSMNDLQTVIDYQPEIFIMGTGTSGVLQVPDLTRTTLKKHGIILIDRKTAQASKLFNERSKKGKKVVGGFHLTC